MKKLNTILSLILLFTAIGALHAQNVVLDKTSMSFSAQFGGQPVSQTLNVTSSGSAISFLVQVPPNSFLSVSPQTGTTPSAVTVTATPGSLLAGTYKAHTATLNTTLTPWRRLFFSTTLSYQNARTITTANDSQSVAPYAGDIYGVMAGASYILNNKTDLSAGYSLSMADFSQDNFAAGLPLGIKYQQHGVQVGLKRRIGKSKILSLRYSFYHYDEPSSGGFNNFNAQAIFATLSFPLR